MNSVLILKDDVLSFKLKVLPIISYIIDVLIIMIIMCMLVYLSFSIVKKNQIQDRFISNENEQRILKEKIDIKNQIDIIQSGIVVVDQENYIIPSRRNLSNHMYDDTSPKIKHLNSLVYDEYDCFK